MRTNEQWLEELTATGEVQEKAILDLRDLLLRATLYSFQRNLGEFGETDRQEILARAEDCTQDALVAVLAHLPDFRGDSKFSTWVYKFAINTALMAARHERWKGVSLDELSESRDGNFTGWMNQDHHDGSSLERSAMQQELSQVLRRVIEQELTEKQRQVLSLMVFQEVPMDEVVRHLKSNRNSVYKLLHDARRKLKSGLLAHGFKMEETFASFEMRR